MGDYWHLMTNVTLPIVFMCMCGVVIQQWKGISTTSLIDVSLYILAPCLIIVALAGSYVTAHVVWDVLWFTLIQTILCWGTAWVTGKLFRLHADMRASLTLTTIFGNANNYGLPLLLLAFGMTGFSLGATYVVGQTILVNSLGLYIASRASVSPLQAIQRIIKTPLIYAAATGMALYITRYHIPTGIASALHLAGDAYPAIVLVILGVQLRTVKISGLMRREVWLAITSRVLLVPFLSALTLWMLGVHGLLESVLFVQSSMPAAVNTTLLVEKFGGDREMTALTVAATTVLSFFSLPLLIGLW